MIDKAELQQQITLLEGWQGFDQKTSKSHLTF
jgi:hypothetical protein